MHVPSQSLISSSKSNSFKEKLTDRKSRANLYRLIFCVKKIRGKKITVLSILIEGFIESKDARNWCLILFDLLFKTSQKLLITVIEYRTFIFYCSYVGLLWNLLLIRSQLLVLSAITTRLHSLNIFLLKLFFSHFHTFD